MKHLTAAALSFLLSACCTKMARLVDPQRRVAAVPDVTYAAPPARPITIARFDWHDAARNRDVPVTIYAPANETSPLPLVIFSHGIGEDRDSYSYLGRAWASRGFIAVHITHAGTDKATLQRGYWHLYRATKKIENWTNRPLDARFAIDQLLAGAAAPLRVDPSRIAVAGHSAGAVTAYALAGMRGSAGSLADPRVKAIIAISPPKIAGVTYDLAVPVLHVTGTCDASPIYRTWPRDRRIPFEQGHAPLQLLVTLGGARHETFSNPEDPLHPLVEQITTAWLEATLNDDARARAWLFDGGLSADGRVVVER